MEGEEDEFGELYDDVLPRSSPSCPIPPLYTELDTKDTKIFSNPEFCQGEPKVENEEFDIHGDFVKDEEETEIKDVNFTIMSHVGKNDGLGFMKFENDGTKSADKNEKTTSFSSLSHSKNDVEYEEKSGVDDLESHPMILELMNSTSDDDVCDDEEDEVSLTVLKIASDCGIGVKQEKDDESGSDSEKGVKQEEDNESGSDSENGLNLIFSDEEFCGCDGIDEGHSGMLGNATSYDDDSYDFKGNWTGLGGSGEDVLHTRLDFILPSHQTIFDININDLKEKRWRRPGVDLTDYFNFGLNELEWKNYCNKLAEISCTEMGIPKGNSQGKVAGESNEQSMIPTGEAIQVEIGIAERFPSLETETPRLSNSDTIVEIIIHDDNSNNDDNAEKFRNIHVDVIRSYPIDWTYQFVPAYGQLASPPEERKGKKDRVEEGTSTRSKNLRPSRYRKPTQTYPARNDRKNESWKEHMTNLVRMYGECNSKDDRITDLIRKYGEDNRKNDLIRKNGEDNRKYGHKSNTEVHPRIKYRNETSKDSRIKRRNETCTLGPRRIVLNRVSNTQKRVSFRENEKKRPMSEGNRRIWSGRRINNSESEREDGEIVDVQRRVSKRKYVDYRNNYRQEKVLTQSYSRQTRNRPLSRPSY